MTRLLGELDRFLDEAVPVIARSEEYRRQRPEPARRRPKPGTSAELNP